MTASDPSSSQTAREEAGADARDERTSDDQEESAAGSVAAGIFSSRILGLFRERALAYFFGVGVHADVWQAAFKVPNLLQNLLGEGTISAAFIPIYSRMIEEERGETAGRFAGAIFGLLLAVAGGTALLGVVLAEPIVGVLAPGFIGDAARVDAGAVAINRFSLAVQAVRIIFPMAGILVLSAWALGVLNSHRQFFLPYVAPALWNAAIIALLFGGAYWVTGTPWAPEELATDRMSQVLIAGCLGALVGGACQFLIQLPAVIRSMPDFELALSTRVEGVREAIQAFGPVVAGRGVAQLSGYLDIFLASFLAVGALSALRYAQLLYMLPVSLFGMSVAASELPELSRLTKEKVRPFVNRLHRSIRQIAFLTIPTVVGYLTFGVLLVGALFRTGHFQMGDTWLVTLVLGGYALGILATTVSRLLQNAFYAIGDTTTPAWIAATRVTVSTVVAIPTMFWLDTIPVADIVGPSTEKTLYLGALGLSLGATIGAWVEVWRLRRALRDPIPHISIPWGRLLQMTGIALFACIPAMVVWYLLPAWHIVIVAMLVTGTYALAYLAVAAVFDFDELHVWTRRFFS